MQRIPCFFLQLADSSWNSFNVVVLHVLVYAASNFTHYFQVLPTSIWQNTKMSVFMIDEYTETVGALLALGYLIFCCYRMNIMEPQVPVGYYSRDRISFKKTENQQ